MWEYLNLNPTASYPILEQSTGYWRHGTCLRCSKAWFEGRKIYLGLITVMPSGGSNFFYLALTHSNPVLLPGIRTTQPKSAVSQTHRAAGCKPKQPTGSQAEAKRSLGQFLPKRLPDFKVFLILFISQAFVSVLPQCTRA